MVRVILLEIDRTDRTFTDKFNRKLLDNTSKIAAKKDFEEESEAVKFLEDYNEKYYEENVEWTQQAVAW